MPPAKMVVSWILARSKMEHDRVAVEDGVALDTTDAITVATCTGVWGVDGAFCCKRRNALMLTLWLLARDTCAVQRDVSTVTVEILSVADDVKRSRKPDTAKVVWAYTGMATCSPGRRVWYGICTYTSRLIDGTKSYALIRLTGGRATGVFRRSPKPYSTVSCLVARIAVAQSVGTMTVAMHSPAVLASAVHVADTVVVATPLRARSDCMDRDGDSRARSTWGTDGALPNSSQA